MPSFEFDAENDDNTSGAPFANAKSVTPAKASLKLNFFDSYSKDGVKYSSAVDPRSKKHMKMQKMQIGIKYKRFPSRKQK